MDYNTGKVRVESWVTQVRGGFLKFSYKSSGAGVTKKGNPADGG
ncbi:MAG: hypothetical protein CM15mV9_2530 [uncultured marine virus]|nr:MAG: hypothetical protein CM15mV9_2530 [uncultured marine virus]